MPAVQIGHVPDPLLEFPLKLLDADVVLAVARDIPVPQGIQPQNAVHLQPQFLSLSLISQKLYLAQLSSTEEK